MFDEFLRQLRLLRCLLFPLPPAPRHLLWDALVLISAYAGFSLTGRWFGWPTGGAFVPAYGLLLVYWMPVGVLHRQQEQRRLVKADPDLGETLSWATHIINLAHVTLAAGLLEWGTTAFCQYIFLIGLLYEAIRRWIPHWMDADAFRLYENVHEKISDRNMRLTMQWQTLRYLGLLVAAVAVMRFGTLGDWIAMRALAPIAAYYLFHWTRRATWDYSSVREAGGRDQSR